MSPDMIVRGLILLLASLLTLNGCDQAPPGAPASPFLSTDITGAPIGGEFRLKDHRGETRSLADFRGKVILLFFGYTHCPDVCPTTLADAAAAMKRIGKDADRVQVLFVTVDPERDSPELLARYVPAFHPGFLGLTGTPGEILAVTRAFKVFFQKQPPTRSGYTIDHFAGTYAFDPQGRLRLLVNFGAGPDQIAHDVAALLRE